MPKGKNDKAAWIGNEVLSKINLYVCPKHFLVDWLNDYNSPLSFIKIRIAKILLRMFFNGTIYDKAIGVKEKYLDLARDVIKKNAIDTIFATGAPFNLLYYTALLKHEFNDVKFIADYRDPWIKAHNLGMSNLSPKKESDELHKQNFVFEHVDYVTAPNVILLQEIMDSYTGHIEKIAEFVELQHAFDPEDVLKGNEYEQRTNKIKIVYAGTLYFSIEKYLKFLNDSFTYALEKMGESPAEITFYTKQKEQATAFENNKDSIKFLDAIGDDIFEVVKSADFILIILTEYNKNYVTSKFFEFLPYQKPYLYVGPEGFVSEKIVNEGFGYYLKNIEDLYNVLIKETLICPSLDIVEENNFDNVIKKFLRTTKLE